MQKNFSLPENLPHSMLSLSCKKWLASSAKATLNSAVKRKLNMKTRTNHLYGNQKSKSSHLTIAKNLVSLSSLHAD